MTASDLTELAARVEAGIGDRPNLLDLCYSVFQAAKAPNNEDGGPSDWFNDVMPLAQNWIAQLERRALREAVAKPFDDMGLFDIDGATLAESIRKTPLPSAAEAPSPTRVEDLLHKLEQASLAKEGLERALTLEQVNRQRIETERDELLAGASSPTEWEDIRAIVSTQAEDKGLWFVARYASEAYLQQELRKLHDKIEAIPLAAPSEEARAG